MKNLRALAALCASSIVMASSAMAQQDTARVSQDSVNQRSAITTPATVAPSSPAAEAGPRFVPSGITRAQASTVAVALPSPSAGQGVGKNKAMMGVGLAAIVVGIIAGGDIGTLFIVGGGVIGLVGLYHYMQ